MRTILTSGFFLLASFGAVLRAERYIYTAIPPLDTQFALLPYAINNRGDVVGIVDSPQYFPDIFRYMNGATDFLIPPSGYGRAEALGVNASGTLIGFGDIGINEHVMYANPGGPLIDIDPNPSSTSWAVGINDYGFIVGYLNGEPMLGNTNGWMTTLTSKLGADFQPAGLNNQLYVVGNNSHGGIIYDVWSQQLVYLSNALGPIAQHASVINQNGAVAGTVGSRGFLYENGTVVRFGSQISEVKGINIHGDVVGDLKSGHGFVYLHASGHFLDLNDVLGFEGTVWTAEHATGINDGGLICGSAKRAAKPGDTQVDNYVHQAFVLSPGFIDYPAPFPGKIAP